MAKHQVGARVRAGVDSHVARDEVGRVAAIHENETFYAVETPDGRTAYLPETRLDPDDDVVDPRVAEEQDHLGFGSGAPTSGLAPLGTGSSSSGLPPASALAEGLSGSVLRDVLRVSRQRSG